MLFLTILSVSSVYLKCIYVFAEILQQKNCSYYSKMALVAFSYKPLCVDVNEVYFEEEQDTPNTYEKIEKKSKRY